MYINPIHAAHVALAQALALAIRTRQSHDPKAAESPDDAVPKPDPAQLMLLSECAGRPDVTALGGPPRD